MGKDTKTNEKRVKLMTYSKHDDNFIYFKGTQTEGAALGADYIPLKKIYRLPRNKNTLQELYKNTGSYTVNGLLQEELKKATLVERLKESKQSVKTSKLREYQQIDAAVVRQFPVLAIFNEQRTGKTPTILDALKNEVKGLIVCPASLKLNWKREHNIWVGKDAVVISGTKQRRLRTYKSLGDNTMIISYETLRADIEDILKIFKHFGYLVVDEAHRLRNHKTKQSKALYKIRKLCKRVYPMTGTPAVNHSADVFGILKLMFPRKYAGYWNFVGRYFTVVDGYFGKEVLGLRKERMKEFNDLLFLNSIQRKRAEVMAWIPKITHKTIELEPTSKQKTTFKQIISKNTLNDEIIDNPLTKLLRLRQVSVDPEYVGITSAKPKFDFVLDYLNDNDESIVVFSTMTGALKRLHKLIPDAVILTGEQTNEEKEHAVKAIQTGKSRVLLANIKAGGTGFTLDKADTIIFLDKSYTPDENDQAADRIVPTNPEATYGAKQIITLLVNGSVEPKIEDMLKEKINIIQYVNHYGLSRILD